MRLVFTSILVSVLVLGGCQTADPPPDDAETPAPTEVTIPNGEVNPANIVDDVGTVQYVDLEGGFYGIVTDDGSRYNPAELDEEYQEDGIRIRFRGYVTEDVATAQMWGEPIEILEIMRLRGGDTE